MEAARGRGGSEQSRRPRTCLEGRREAARKEPSAVARPLGRLARKRARCLSRPLRHALFFPGEIKVPLIRVAICCPGHEASLSHAPV